MHSVCITKKLRADIKDGFPHGEGGEDKFDALIGLLGMIGVVEGSIAEGLISAENVVQWEGWMLGRGE